MDYKQVQLEDLGLTVGAYNALKKNKVPNLEALLKLSEEDIQSFPQITRQRVEEIVALINRINTYSLTEEDLLCINADYKVVKGRNDESFYINTHKPIWNIGFELITFNCLKRNKIENAGDLINLTSKQIEELEGISLKSIKEIEQYFEKVKF